MSVLTQIKEVWNRLPASGRIATVSAAVVTLGMIAAIVYYGSQPEYGVLFSDLKPTDAQAIVEKLKAANVPYSLVNNGTTIQIPQERIAETRLQMASSGVLSGGHVGFDLFDKTNFGATDFAQQVNFRRAIEGELAKTLEGTDEIEAARVHITPRKESVFTEKEESAKASVVLRVRQGRELSNERTDAIVSLIASSVEGLDPSNVSVMDARGRLLAASGRSNSGAFGDAGEFNAQLQSKQKFEAESAARIIALLEPVVGEGHVRADISADVDFSKVEQTEKKFNPQSQVVRSQQTSQESRNSTQKNPNAAVVGARANDPTAQASPSPAQATDTTTNGDQRANSTTNYEIDETVRKTIGGGGRINRLSVSVIVDHKMVNGVQTARTPEEVQQMQDLVAAAVGIDQKRGDAVVVQTMPFDQPKIEANNATFFEQNKQFVPSIIKYAALIFVAFLLFLFVIRPAQKALKAAVALPVEQPKLLASAEAIETSAETLIEGEIAGRRNSDEAENLIAGNVQELPQVSPMMTVADLEAQMQADLERETAVGHTSVKRAQTIKKMLAEQTINEPDTIVSTLRGWLRES